MLELIADNDRRGTPIEAIVIETTGVAEPLPIVWAMEREPLARAVRLAAVVTLVDATGFVSARPLSPAVDAQVEHADVLVMTKAELGDPTATRRAARELNPTAPWVEGTTEEVAQWLDEMLEDPDDAHAHAHSHAHAHAHAHDHDHDHVHDHVHGAAHGIDSVWVPIEGLLDLEE